MNVQDKLERNITIHEKRKLIQQQLLAFAQTHQVPCISSATQQWLVKHLMKYKPVQCFEIGSAIGYSTSILASKVQQRGGSVISCEISHPSYMIAVYHQRQMDIRNTTIYYSDFLQLPIDKLVTRKLDFIFIDAMKAHYHLYLECLLPFCAPGATIICDDMINFADKVHPIFDVIQTHHLSYQQISLADGDGILLIKL